ncbi:MAG: 23S rRNA (uracil(1939)-C(5))-methyltransferase RlmD [Lysobacteraceae bacterium]|nr:MAG: 23S rRNA (uracil(1939)-C(5))-methyltransferase RlmD [Xanthomonadaceae bacterium]
MGREVEIEIQDLSHDGRGVGRIEGKAVFVAGALPGERVRARVTARRRSFDEAATLEVLRASPHRVEPRCAAFGVCGGCALQHLHPAVQIEAKQKVLLENLERIAKVQPESVLEPLTDRLWQYRRKARLGVRRVHRKGRVLVGFREARDPRYIADCSRCEVLVPEVGERLGELAELVGALKIAEKLPQIEVAAGDAATALVLRHLEPLGAADLEALRAFSRRTGLIIHLQPGGTDSVRPLDPDAPSGLDFAVDDGAVRLAFEPLDFVQVNAGMNRRMIARALDLLELEPGHRVLDLFCGLGNFTLPIARRVKAAVGVEGEAALVERARRNARNNGLHNAEFHVADLSRPLAGADWLEGDYDRLLLDPPRTGADGILPQLPLARIPRVVYVSCHPGSLARDAGMLVHQHGFRLRAAGVMDMFPHTAHVESIALFERD